MKRFLRLVPYILGGLLVLLILPPIMWSVMYSPDYVRRVLSWQDADVYDYQKFPAREFPASDAPFYFNQPDDPASAEAEVLEAFAGDEAVGDDLDAFLEASGTQAFIVIRDDVILYEHYFNGAQRDSIVTSFSVAKSYLSTLIVIAAEERLVDPDAPITEYLPELAARDERFANITVRHLLNMSSGIRYVEMSLPSGDDALTYYFPDLRELALERTRIVGEPGETWLYNNYHPLLLGLILERTTKMPVADYLNERLWQRIGTEYGGSWSLDSEESGFEKLESGINARAIDFAKLGRLYLNEGNWQGDQIVPVAWVQAATRIDLSVDRASYFEDWMDAEHGKAFHQLLWWGVQQDDGDYAFYAHGNHGQFIFVWPAKRLIIVRHGERYHFDSGGEWIALFTRAAERIAGPAN